MLQNNAVKGSASENKDLSHIEACFSLPFDNWQPSPDSATQKQAVEALEHGKVLHLPDLPFIMTPEEQLYLRPDCVDSKTKSVKYSLPKKTLWGASESEKNSSVLANMLERYAHSSKSLVEALFPGYTGSLIIGNTSFRPVGVEGRMQSKRHDDSRLHVDAFPSRPAAGQRLLRVFSNIHPGGQARVWRVGEPFREVAEKFLPRISPPFPGSAKLLKALKITKGIRTPYDHYMLNLHDRMKLDSKYQVEAGQTIVPFPSATTWIVFSDQVSHAAMSGQHLMEQTFMLPVEAMNDPETSPLRVLENLKGMRLV